MTMNIKNQEAHDLARELARLTGESLTQAVTNAIRERIDRVRGEAGAAERIRQMEEISRRMASRFSDEWREIDHGELLYDERGLPK